MAKQQSQTELSFMEAAARLTGRTVNEVRKEAEAGMEQDQKQAQMPVAEVIQLPIWPDECRGLPVAMARSALFGVIRRGKRRAVESELLASWKDVEIRYTGFRLDQADLDSWLQVLHIARRFPLGKEARFTARGFLKDIGRNNTGNSHRWLRRSIGRLQACGVSIKVGRLEYVGSLVESFARDEVSGRYVVSVNPRLAQLFDEAFVRLSVNRRRMLRADLAKWLQGYVQSHRATRKDPHRIGLERLKDLSESETKERWKFRQQLKKALGELKAALILESFEFSPDGMNVQWVRSPNLLPLR